MGSWVERTQGKAVAGGSGEAVDCRLGGPHSGAEKSGATTGERDRPYNPGFQYWEIKPQTSD